MQLGVDKYNSDKRAFQFQKASIEVTEKEVQAAMAKAEAERVQLSGKD